MTDTNPRFAPILSARERQTLMKQYRVTRPQLVDSILRHARSIDNGRQQLEQLTVNCPHYFRRTSR